MRKQIQSYSYWQHKPYFMWHYKCFLLIFRKFEDHAVQIIEECYKTDPDFAIELLTTKSELYFHSSPLKLAQENGSRSFLSTDCVQNYLDRLWYGDIHNEHVKYSMNRILALVINNQHKKLWGCFWFSFR